MSFWNLHTLHVTTSCKPGRGKIAPHSGQKLASDEKSSLFEVAAMTEPREKTWSWWRTRSYSSSPISLRRQKKPKQYGGKKLSERLWGFVTGLCWIRAWLRCNEGQNKTIRYHVYLQTCVSTLLSQDRSESEYPNQTGKLWACNSKYSTLQQ